MAGLFIGQRGGREDQITKGKERIVVSRSGPSSYSSSYRDNIAVFGHRGGRLWINGAKSPPGSGDVVGRNVIYRRCEAIIIGRKRLTI